MKKHPLKNSNSSHYDKDGLSHIDKIESELSVSAMMGSVEFNISKYEWRKDLKGQREGDEEKIATYKAYRDVLKSLLHRGYKSHTVAHALDMEGISYD